MGGTGSTALVMLTPMAPLVMPDTFVTPKSATKPGMLSTALMPFPAGEVTLVWAIATEPLDWVRSRPGPVLVVELAVASVRSRSALLAAIEAPPVALIVPPSELAPAFVTTRPLPASVVTLSCPSLVLVASSELFCRTTPSPCVLLTVVVGELKVRAGELRMITPS